MKQSKMIREREERERERERETDRQTDRLTDRGRESKEGMKLFHFHSQPLL